MSQIDSDRQPDEDFSNRLTRIEQRLAAIESRLEMSSGIGGTWGDRNTRRSPLAEPSEPKIVLPPPLPIASASPAPSSPAPSALPMAAAGTMELGYETPASSSPLISHGSLEQTIGLKWAGWIGALVLMIGAGLGVKLAYDSGWFGRMPPETRLALMALAGFALISAGEWVLRRINPISAAALFGSGIGVLFVVSYAAQTHGYGQVVSRDGAFMLMGLVTLIGAAVALRGGMVSVAILSLLGGNLAPLVLGSDHPRIGSFLGYLLTLLLVGLFLSARGRCAKWWTVRWLTAITTWLWTFALMQTVAADVPYGLVFFGALIFGALMHAELMIGVARRAVQAGGPHHKGGDAGVQAGGPDQKCGDTALPAGGTDHTEVSGGDNHERGDGASIRWSRRAAGYSIVATGGAAAVIIYLTRHQPAVTRGAWVVALAGASAAMGWLAIRLGPKARALPMALAVAAGALIVVAVPVSLGHMNIVIGWGLLGVIFAVLGARMQLPAARLGAAATWFCAVAYLRWWIGDDPDSAQRIAVTIHGVGLTENLFLAWALALVGTAIGWLIRWRLPDLLLAVAPLEVADDAGTAGLGRPASGDIAADGYSADDVYTPAQPGPTGAAPARGWNAPAELRKVGWAVCAIAGLLWAVASIAALPAPGASIAIVVYVWIAVGVGLALASTPLAIVGAGMLVLAAVKWIVIDVVASRFGDAWFTARYDPVINPVMGAGALIAVSIVGIALVHWRRITRDLPADSVALARILPLSAVAIFILGLGLSLEIDRAVGSDSVPMRHAVHVENLAWTLLWTLAASIQIALAWRLTRDPPARSRALAVVGFVPLLLGIKYLLFDTLFLSLFSSGAADLRLKSLAALGLLGALAMTFAALPARADAGGRDRAVRIGSQILFLLVLLRACSLEIGTAVDQIGWDSRAKQAAFSVFWAAFAISSVLMGFRFRLATPRYFGLALFAVTLIKVVAIDLSDVATGWRIVSFMGLGVLLLGTSVLYGKLSPRLLGPPTREDAR